MRLVGCLGRVQVQVTAVTPNQPPPSLIVHLLMATSGFFVVEKALFHVVFMHDSTGSWRSAHASHREILNSVQPLRIQFLRRYPLWIFLFFLPLLQHGACLSFGFYLAKTFSLTRDGPLPLWSLSGDSGTQFAAGGPSSRTGYSGSPSGPIWPYSKQVPKMPVDADNSAFPQLLPFSNLMPHHSWIHSSTWLFESPSFLSLMPPFLSEVCPVLMWTRKRLFCVFSGGGMTLDFWPSTPCPASLQEVLAELKSFMHTKMKAMIVR